MSSTPGERLEELERRLAKIERELEEARVLLGLRKAEPAPPAEPAPRFTPPARVEAPVPPSAPVEPRPAPAVPRPRWFEGSHDLQLADLLGARALAWAGGVVTLLGIVLFFALAVNRGWIGPGTRCVLGALASAIVFAGGVTLRRRFGETFSSPAAVGAGIAGGYATLLAAGPRYDLLPDAASLALAAGIAALALGVALIWSSELVAGLGLVGAMLVQIPIAWGDGLTAAGTGFTALMFTAAAAVVVAQTWRTLLTFSSLATVPQVVALAAEHVGHASVGRVAAVAGCAVVLLAAGIGLQLRSDSELEGYPATVTLGAAVLASLCLSLLFGSFRADGEALLVVSAVYAALAVAFFRRAGRGDLSALLGAIALAVAAVAVADLLSGSSLAIAWAAEAAVLAWLSRRIDDPRYELASAGYLLLATGHALMVDTPPRHLFVEVARPAAGIAAPIAVACAAAVFAERCLPAPQSSGHLRDPAFDSALAGVRTAQPELRFGAALLGALAALYAASLGLLELPPSFAWNHVWVTALLAFGPVVALRIALWRGWRAAQGGAAVVLALALAKSLSFDVVRLDAPPRAWSLLTVAAALLVAGALYAHLGTAVEPVDPWAFAAVGASLPLGVIGTFDLLDGRWHSIDRTGAALVLVAAVYAAFSCTAFRALRDLATLLWASSALVAGIATGLLLHGTPRALVWSFFAVVLVGLSLVLDEDRFQAGAAAYVAAATVHAIALDSPPTDFFESGRHPASGAGAVAAAAVAAFLLARASRIPDWLRPYLSRVGGFALSGVLATYAASLVVLELFELEGGRVETRFERGHAAVSALWGLLALALLYLGLTRTLPLRIAGFALFGVTLAKIFLYDLSTLSPVARALSFLAVGAVLLLGGFFYQRLSAEAVDGGPATGR